MMYRAYNDTMMYRAYNDVTLHFLSSTRLIGQTNFLDGVPHAENMLVLSDGLIIRT